MQNATRKVGESLMTYGGDRAIRRTRIGPVDSGAKRPETDADVMIDPLHPMHQDLLARISGSRIIAKRLTGPQRLAIAFYAAISAWGLVWLSVQGLAQAL